jgi:hypothetical protein
MGRDGGVPVSAGAWAYATGAPSNAASSRQLRNAKDSMGWFLERIRWERTYTPCSAQFSPSEAVNQLVIDVLMPHQSAEKNQGGPSLGTKLSETAPQQK